MPMTRHRHLCLGQSGFYHIDYSLWQDAAAPDNAIPTICVHGLTRNGRDFDRLGAALSPKGPVLSPDVVGRGTSDWLRDPNGYAVPFYANDVASLIARLGVDHVNYVGTSMGGMIGMVLASRPGNPIRRLVLNDVGPFLPKEALQRIGTYVGASLSFATEAELEAHLRHVHAPFGNLSDEDWRHLAQFSTRQLENGRLALAYDPAIAIPFRGPVTDVDLWPYYDAIACPTLVIRGAQSDLLLAETAEEMTRRGPHAKIYEVPDAGHAPALMADDQIAAISAFLE